MKRETDRLPSEWAAHLAMALDPIEPKPDRAAQLRKRILERVEAEARPDPHLTLRAKEGSWRTLNPGIDIKLLRREAGSVSYLLRMAAGMRIPAHDHTDDEECFVLEGDVWLGNTHTFAGDYHLARRGVPHGELHSETGCLLFLRGPKPEAASHYA